MSYKLLITNYKYQRKSGNKTPAHPNANCCSPIQNHQHSFHLHKPVNSNIYHSLIQAAAADE